MAIQRMDHVGLVVEDLAAARAFFDALGLRVQSEWSADGELVDRVLGLHGARTENVMMETPDGHMRLELSRFHAPPGPGGDRRAPAHTPGIRHLTFAVDDLDGVLARVQAHGAEPLGEVQRYENSFLLCFIRGPEGIIIELAQPIG
jgi:catechol 2,3-dioxygenase-like lactoylglutathione lyase family enzyme